MTKVKKIIEEEVGGVEHPADESHGDFSSNIALKTGVDANEMKKKLENNKKLMEVVEKIEVKGPGFINFWLKKDWLVKEMTEVMKQGKDYGKGGWGKGKRMVIDYSAPNIAKQFSVGHLRSTIIGQSIYNLYKFSGWKCVGDNHLGDWGTQFGMIIAAVEEKNLDVSKMSVADLESEYVEFNRSMDEKPERRDLAREAFARLENGDIKARQIWEQAIEVSMKEFEEILC